VAFTDGVTFTGAAFGSDANFAGAAFGGRVCFDGAVVSGRAFFIGASFGGGSVFRGTHFKGEVDFTGQSEEQWARDVADVYGNYEEAHAALEKCHQITSKRYNSGPDRFLIISMHALTVKQFSQTDRSRRPLILPMRVFTARQISMV
jgi:Pentapeptide repeats (9 copies)